MGEPFSLAGKTAVVTGGGRGIGRGISECLSRAGASIVLAARTRGPLEETAEGIVNEGGNAHVVLADLSTHEGIERTVREATDAFGYIDCWINNAGNLLMSDVAPLLEIDDENWHRTVDLNLKWPFFAAQAAARTMTRGGSIVNVSSLTARGPSPTLAHYGAAKAGLDRLTQTMAAEWGHLGIRVNGVAPGFVLTERNRGRVEALGDERDPLLDITCIQRHGRPEDIGAACVFFAADASSFVTGTVLPVDGGQLVSALYLSYMAEQRRP
jgi:NAD(P)-dependent dehydrogenase (short-subunit alcohol dehydrogenase family)